MQGGVPHTPPRRAWSILVSISPHHTLMRPAVALRESGIALRAALRYCAEHPSPKHVHQLRTYTRRIEALLELLPHIPQLPATSRESARFRKAVHSTRKATGATRDLDVLLNLLATLPHQNGKEFAMGVAQLTVKLENRRDRAAEKLTKRIASMGGKLLHALDKLETALAPARGVSTNAAEIDRIAREHFHRTAARSTHHSLKVSPDKLHDIRKSAKLTRYLAEFAEGAPRSKVAHTAQRFHTVQEKIGAWHDWILLTKFARKYFGDDHALCKALQEREQRSHAAALRAAAKLL
jgi:CHAD domain-containing protein